MTGQKLASAALLTLILMVTQAGPVRAQDPGDVRVGITYTPGYLPGLVMTPVESQGALGNVATQVDSILRRDLDYADRFQIIPVPDELSTDGPVNYGLWNQLGAVWLVVSEVTGTPDVPVLRVSLHDVVFSELKEVKAFSLPRPGDLGVPDGGPPGVRRGRDVGDRRTRHRGHAHRLPAHGHADRLGPVPDRQRRVRSAAADDRGGYQRQRHRDVSGAVAERSIRGVCLVQSGKSVIYEMDLVTGAEKVISDVGRINVTPVYSPDGRRILFGRTQDDHTELFEIQRDPLCCTRRVTFTGTGETLGGAYSPDGRQLAITSTPLGNPQIYVMDLQRGGDPAIVSRYVFGERGYATSPHWSPRGDRIAYHTWVDSWFQIVTVNPDGTDRRVMTSRGSNEDPSWAPDGRHLVFAGTLRGYYALWVLDTVSGRLRSVTVNQVDQLPHWSTAVSPGS